MPQTNKLSKCLLIIDNSVFITERLINMLEDVEQISGIISASNYDEALEILYAQQVDIVLLDIQMPGKNGIDLLKHIAYHFPEISIIVLSNLVSEYYQKLCISEGASYFVDKTGDFEKIPAIIRTL